MPLGLKGFVDEENRGKEIFLLLLISFPFPTKKEGEKPIRLVYKLCISSRSRLSSSE